MPIRFFCQACDARMRVPDGSFGRKAKCPRCGFLQAIPGESETESDHEVLARESRSQERQLNSGLGRSDPGGSGRGLDEALPDMRRVASESRAPQLHEQVMKELPGSTSDQGDMGIAARFSLVAWRLLICCWVLRVASVLLIGGVFKVMLVGRSAGASGVECALYLLAGLAGCAALYTVGEIAMAQRGLLLRRRNE